MSETNDWNEAPNKTIEESAPISFAEFLESVPPNQWRKVLDSCPIKHTPAGAAYHELAKPELELHCTSDACNGPRFFRYEEGSVNLTRGEQKMTYLTYVCSNCREGRKIFSLLINGEGEDSIAALAYKFGEQPNYGPPVPARLIRLLGDKREIFLRGRLCENQGLGIAAFVYYSRVVENHKNEILDEIIGFAQKVGAPAEMIKTLGRAKKEKHFKKAFQSVKDAVPPALLINGHNPLMLLNSALSGDLHQQTDESGLELAHDVRVVLIELAERLGQSLKDEAELNTVVRRLLQAKQDN
jgi:hypothetical protein